MSNTLQAIIEIAGVVSPTLGKSLQDAENKLGKVNKTSLLTKAAMVAGVAGIATFSAKAAKALTDLGTEYSQAMNQFAASTGTSGEKLKAAGEIAKNVYANNYGESLNDVTEALAEVNKMTGKTGEELQNVTESGIALRDTFGYEINESTRAASALMKNFGVDSEKAYNLIAYGAQNGADQNGDLLDTLNEYSVQYSALGLSADQFVQGLVKGSEEGVFSIDKVGDAVKEFNIRSKDGSDSSKQSFEAIGLNANEMFKKFAAGGDTANQAFFQVVEKLQAMEDPVKKNAAAVGLFGTQYEDLEQNILPILSGMKDATLDNVDAMNQIKDVKYNDLFSTLEGIKRKAQVAFIPLGEEMAKGLMELTPSIEDMMNSVIPMLVNFASVFGQVVMPPLKEIMKSVLPAISTLMQAIIPIISTLSTLLQPLMSVVQSFLPPILQLINTAIVPMIQQLSNLINLVIPPLLPLLNVLGSLFGSTLAGAVQSVVPIIGNISGALQGLIDFISGVFSLNLSTALSGITGLFSNIFGGLVGIVKAPFNAIIGAINGFFSGLSKVKIPDWVPGVGGKGINISPLPYLATGGFTTGPSIAGEAGQEAVISFARRYRNDNIGYWAEAGERLGIFNSQDGLLNGNDNQSLTKYVTNNKQTVINVEYAPVVNISDDSRQSKETFRKMLKEHAEEFADMLEEIMKDKDDFDYDYDPCV